MWKKTLAEYGLALDAVWQSEKSVQVIVYNIRWLKRIMDDRFILSYLYGKGYVDCRDITGTVRQILSRMKNVSPFPHEIGIILGYPFFDVLEFERAWRTGVQILRLLEIIFRCGECQALSL